MADLLEAFPGRLPSEIEAEIQRQPAGFVESVLEARAYMKAKVYYDRVTNKADLPKDWPMLDLVRAVSWAEVARKREEIEHERRYTVTVADGSVGMRRGE